MERFGYFKSLEERKVSLALCERISDAEWAAILSLMPQGHAGTRARSDPRARVGVEAVLWVADNQGYALWTHLPEAAFGDWRSHHARFMRWARSGQWQAVVLALRDRALAQALDDLVRRYLTMHDLRRLRDR